MKKTFSLILVAAAAISVASKIEISFDAAADREVWVLDEIPDRMPAAGRQFNTKTIPVEVSGNSQVIVVHDPKAASVAIKRAGDVTGGWAVADKDWRAAVVTVKAYRSGEPLDEGRVELNAPSFTKSMPIEDGQAKFFAVPYGDVEVKVDYKGGGIPPTAPQVFRIKKDGGEEGRTIGVTVVADPSAETGPQSPEQVPTPQPSAPWYARLAVWLVALAAAAAGLVFLMRFLKDRSDLVEEKLKGLGVPIPGDLAKDPEDDIVGSKPFEPEPVVPAGHCAYCGKEQSECVCRLDAPKVSAASREPEFVGLGVELRIPEGESIVGREGDLVVSDPTVSRQHAKITREDNTVTVEDLGSSNGTFVDGVRIEAPTVVKPGATVHFGSVKVRLEG